jgi:hypothetical protein
MFHPLLPADNPQVGRSHAPSWQLAREKWEPPAEFGLKWAKSAPFGFSTGDPIFFL